MSTVISALISAGVTLLICLITTHAQSEKDRALLEYKLDELTKKVDEHNKLIDRTYKLEQEVSVHEEKIKVANNRIKNLEEKEGLA
ncbi:MAG: hypothetical protein LUD72_11135 [Bacteroidales bacterium]|nr:hypothetical protein [Bacteroidales bacterium]